MIPWHFYDVGIAMRVFSATVMARYRLRNIILVRQGFLAVFHFNIILSLVFSWRLNRRCFSFLCLDTFITFTDVDSNCWVITLNTRDTHLRLGTLMTNPCLAHHLANHVRRVNDVVIVDIHFPIHGRNLRKKIPRPIVSSNRRTYPM